MFRQARAPVVVYALSFNYLLRLVLHVVWVHLSNYAYSDMQPLYALICTLPVPFSVIYSIKIRPLKEYLSV